MLKSHNYINKRKISEQFIVYIIYLIRHNVYCRFLLSYKKFPKSYLNRTNINFFKKDASLKQLDKTGISINVTF